MGRMARKVRVEFPGAIYHLTVRANGGAGLLGDPRGQTLNIKNGLYSWPSKGYMDAHNCNSLAHSGVPRSAVRGGSHGCQRRDSDFVVRPFRFMRYCGKFASQDVDHH